MSKKLAAPLLTACAIVTLTGCAAFTSQQQVDALNAATPQGSAFSQRLTLEYRDFATFEQEEMFDYTDAEHFARKGLTAASGELVAPEDPGVWQIPEGIRAELDQARQQLIAALDSGARDLAPNEAAIAQARYDCWVEQQEEGWQEGDIAACRDTFWLALNQLDMALAPPASDMAEETGPVIPSRMQPAPVEPVLAAPAPQPMMEDFPAAGLSQASFLVFFDFAEEGLTPIARDVVDTIANEFFRGGPDRITLVGHADSVGSDNFNMSLSADRAENVREALISLGVPASIIQVEARGEADPLVATRNNVREPANRRVEIRFG